jgi:hypothetical protein
VIQENQVLKDLQDLLVNLAALVKQEQLEHLVVMVTQEIEELMDHLVKMEDLVHRVPQDRKEILVNKGSAVPLGRLDMKGERETQDKWVFQENKGMLVKEDIKDRRDPKELRENVVTKEIKGVEESEGTGVTQGYLDHRDKPEYLEILVVLVNLVQMVNLESKGLL